MGSSVRDGHDGNARLHHFPGPTEKQMNEQDMDLDWDRMIPRRNSTAPCPLSFAQERLWFLDQYEPNSPLYNVAVRLCLRGVLNIEALKNSLSSLVARHESLRTTFNAVDGSPMQVIGESRPFDLQTVDLRTLPPEKREAELQRISKELAERPFNLSTDLMIRGTLTQLSTAEYELLLILHHIAFDGWSIGVLFRELTEYYRAYSTGTPPNLPELPIQYADFAIWQRQRLKGRVLEEELAYWTKQLAGEMEFEQFPIDHPRPARQTYHGRREILLLPAQLTELLKGLGRRESASLFMVLLAAFQVLLRRYTGHQDVLVGSVIANRNRLELEGLIGFFVNTLVLRTNFSDNPTFRELLARVRATALDSYDHQELPFEKLVQVLRPERTPTHAPLCQVVFVYEDNPPAPVELPGLSLSISDEEHGVSLAKFDLTVTIEWKEGLRVCCTYNSDLFEASTIRQMLGHCRRLLEAIVENPAQAVDTISLLTEEERRRQLLEWNATGREYPELCVHQLFETQAAKTPEATALVFEGWRLSYRELNQRANRLARHLRTLGVGPEVTVGLCLERSPEAIVGLLGILKAGGAYVPLDPIYPRERLSFMVEDAGARVVLTITRWLDKLPRERTTAVCLDHLPESFAPEELENIAAGVGPDNLAYVIYTSGSTGEPKGVEICHRAIVRLLIGANYAKFTSQEVFLQLAPLSFDAATFEIWGALLHGATLVLFPRQVPAAQSLAEVLRRENVTTLWLTSSLFNAVIDEAPAALSSVRQLLVGGEALSAAHIRRALSALPETQLINGYGPTESTTFACCYSIPRSLEEAATSIPIGRPISNTQVYILDKQLQPVPIGGVGELHIGGDGLGRGYLNRPDLTFEKFIANPFSERPGDRLYKTGDLARYLPDGNIEFIGRLDDQIKIRGYRIEPGEIEAALTQHPAVKAAVVVPHEIQPAEKLLVAYVVPKGGQALTAEGLQAFLKQKLPRYMVPARFMFVASLPLTPNGKVDRRALPAPEAVEITSHREFVAPRDEVESKLLEIWQSVLGIRTISVTDNFFDLGGHSLLVVRMMGLIERACGVRLPLATLFAGATVELLAKALLDAEPEKANSPVVAVQSEGSNPPFFFFHGDWTSGGLYCQKLAKSLGKEQPFFAIGPHGLAGERIPLTIEEMAADRLRTLLEIRPSGPYLIGGFCNGGLVAFEMARQMQELGLKVDLLVVIDASAMNVHFRWLRSLIRFLGFVFRLQNDSQFHWFRRFRNLIVGLGDLSENGKRAQLAFFLGKVKGYLKKVRSSAKTRPRMEAGMTHGYYPTELISDAFTDAVQGYIPGSYPGRVDFFQLNSTPLPSHSDPTFGWRDIAEQVEVHLLACDHTTFRRGQIEGFAKELGDCLRTTCPPPTTADSEANFSLGGGK
jgi:amino acid adenylation domain-containing protein